MEQHRFPVTKKEAEKTGIPYSSEANKNALFPSRLRLLRERKGVSQAVLASTLGVSKSTIGLYETGDTLPDAKTVYDLATYFQVSTDYLLCRTDIKSPDPNMSEALKALGITDTVAYLFTETHKRKSEGETEWVRRISNTINDFLSADLIVGFFRNVQYYVDTAVRMADHNNPDTDDEDFGREYDVDGFIVYDIDILSARLQGVERLLVKVLDFMVSVSKEDVKNTALEQGKGNPAD